MNWWPSLAVVPPLLLLTACGDARPRTVTVDHPPDAESDQAPAAAPSPADPYIPWNLPTWASEALRPGGHDQRYEFFTGLNPYFQRGRFDEDDAIDIAVQVREKASGKRGVAIIHRATSTVHILGAGQSFGNGGDDFSWLWVWRVEPREAIKEPLVRGRELLYVEKPESAGGMIWWNGSNYVWTQWGD